MIDDCQWQVIVNAWGMGAYIHGMSSDRHRWVIDKPWGPFRITESEAVFWDRPLHYKCPNESIFYKDLPKCSACLWEDRRARQDHDPGDEDRT